MNPFIIILIPAVGLMAVCSYYMYEEHKAIEAIRKREAKIKAKEFKLNK